MIDPATYHDIVCSFDAAHQSAIYAVQEINNMINVLNNMVIADLRRATIQRNMFELQNVLTGYTNNVPEEIALIRSLHTFIDNQYGLVDFLQDNGLTVPEYVATVSASVGFAIPTQYIAACD